MTANSTHPAITPPPPAPARATGRPASVGNDPAPTARVEAHRSPGAQAPGHGGGLRSLVAFAVLAYGWTWGLMAAAGVLLESGALSEAAAGVLGDVAGYGPSVAAVVVAAALGRTTLRELLGSLARWRFSLLWYLAALYGPAAVAVAGAAVWYGPGALAYERLWPIAVTRYLPFALVTLATAGPVQEELGWRGFALPRLQRRFGPLAGTAILGAAWAAWHLPNVHFRGWDAPATALFLLATFLIAFPYTWLANHTRASVLLAMVLHAGVNTSTRLASALVPESALTSAAAFEAATHAWLALAYGAVAVVLLVATRGRLGRGSRGSRGSRGQ